MVNSLRGARSRTQWSRPAGCREHTAHATRIFHELPPQTPECWAHFMKVVSLWWSIVCVARATERNGCTLQVLGSTPHTPTIFSMSAPPPPNPRVLSPLSKDCFLEMVNSLRGARSRTQWSRPAGCREHTAHATRIFHELPRELNPLSKDRFLVMVNSLRDQHNAADAPFLSYRTLLTPLPFPSNACTSSSFVHISHILVF